MVSGVSFSDYDLDGDLDLITVGEWSPIRIYENNGGRFALKEVKGLENTVGLWLSLEKCDIDGDGDDDFFAGNLGLNTKYKIGVGKEFHIYADDFDQSGNVDIVLSNKYKGNLVPVRGLECSSQQIPAIKNEFLSFQSFAKASLEDIYGEKKLNNAFHIQADILYSVFLKNKGNGKFEIIKLPNEAQISPIRGFEFVDIDGNGKDEILIIGNLYESEVETVRYDGSYGEVLAYSNNSVSKFKWETGFFVDGNARDITTINTQKGKMVLVAHNDALMQGFYVNKK
jgi:hypothetical protein